MPRHQLAVAPKLSPVWLARSVAAMCAPPDRALVAVGSALRGAFGAKSSVLTDSGTSALVLALRLMVREGGIVALPGYGCVDLAAAVRFAGVRARVYDVDPLTMSPDLDSVERALRRGAEAVLVAHYYGYPADVPGVRALASAHGVPVLEDAAQGAGGRLGGHRLGTLGDLSVLSFGRGKGVFGGRGGALMSFSEDWAARVGELEPLRQSRGFGVIAGGIAQWSFGRPFLYAFPASIPSLRLGEMVYRPAHEPQALSAVAASLVRDGMAAEERELLTRRRHAAVFLEETEPAEHQIVAVPPILGAHPGYLRFPVLDRSASREDARRLGIMRGYPRTLHEQRELRPNLLAGEPSTPGATELRASLFTLPTHAFVTAQDLGNLRAWIRRSARTAGDDAASSAGAIV